MSFCLNSASSSSYYNKSVVLLHSLTFNAELGHGFSGSVGE